MTSSEELQECYCRVMMAIPMIERAAAREGEGYEGDPIGVLGEVATMMRDHYSGVTKDLLNEIPEEKRPELRRSINIYVQRTEEILLLRMARNSLNSIRYTVYPQEVNDKLASVKKNLDRIMDRLSEEALDFYKESILSITAHSVKKSGDYDDDL